MYEFIQKVQQLEALTEVASFINSSLDHAKIRKRTIESTSRVLNVAAASLLLLDEDTGELYFDVATGVKGGRLKKVKLEKGKGIASYVAETGESLIIDDAQNDPRVFKDADKASGFVTKNIICTPVKSKDKIIGVLEGINKNKGRFDDDDLKLINSLANYVAVAIENARLFEDLRNTFHTTAVALAETIELRDPYTGGHTQRVKDYSVMIGHQMGLNEDEIESLKLAAIFHDIGKIGVRDNVLHKNGRLDPDELAHMNKHSDYGADLLKKVPQLKNIIPGIRGHHERYDGNGYPEKLKNGNIPLIARIITVADTFDAMTTDRPYRKGLTTEVAIEELTKHSGAQFDPEIAEIFICLLKEGAISK